MFDMKQLMKGQILQGNCGKYRVGTLLGEGGIGQVWSAVNIQSDVKVAIKVLHSTRFELSDVVYNRFVRETVHGSLISHENLVSIIDSSMVDESQADVRVDFLVMNLVDAVPLSSLVATLHKASVNTA